MPAHIFIFSFPNSECQLVNTTLYIVHIVGIEIRRKVKAALQILTRSTFILKHLSTIYLGIGYWHLHFAHHLSIHLFPSSKSENRRDIFSPFFGCSFCCQPTSQPQPLDSATVSASPTAAIPPPSPSNFKEMRMRKELEPSIDFVYLLWMVGYQVTHSQQQQQQKIAASCLAILLILTSHMYFVCRRHSFIPTPTTN